jgi:hypothetical protein
MASALAEGIRAWLLGSAPIFATPVSPSLPYGTLFWAALIGLSTGVVSGILTKLVYWVEDGYRLFSISAAFDGSSHAGWFTLPSETNTLFLRRDHWRELGGYDPGFVLPGGGLVNLDIWKRVCSEPRASVIMLFGEATFHQVHGGVSTNTPHPPFDAWADEYYRIRGSHWQPPEAPFVLFGSPNPAALKSVRKSLG